MPIDERTSVLARSESASELLTTRGASLAHESGFFRLGQTFLSREDVRRGSAAVRELLARGNIKRQGRAEEVLFTFATAPHLTRSIGQRMILHYFAHDVLFERPEPLRKAILDYVHKSLIPDDVRRRSIGHYANLASLRHDIAKALQAQECRTPWSSPWKWCSDPSLRVQAVRAGRELVVTSSVLVSGTRLRRQRARTSSPR